MRMDSNLFANVFLLCCEYATVGHTALRTVLRLLPNLKTADVGTKKRKWNIHLNFRIRKYRENSLKTSAES